MIALIPAAVVLLIVLVRVLGALLAASTSPPAPTDQTAELGPIVFEVGEATPHSYYMQPDPGSCVDAATIARWVAPSDEDRDRESMRRFYRGW